MAPAAIRSEAIELVEARRAIVFFIYTPIFENMDSEPDIHSAGTAIVLP
jgi:hypothetical protein